MKTALSLVACALVVALTGCTPPPDSNDGGAGSATRRAEIKIDGSSTVFPISEAMAEEFMKANPDVKVTVGTSGTGGGFKKFVAKEIAIADASRPIEQKEIDAAKASGVTFIELPIAYDGLSIVVNPKNTWAKTLTVAELKTIWATGSTVQSWKAIRAGFPDKPLKLYGPGTDSGTFDYFTEAICGKKGASRADYTASEDDNVLVTGVEGDDGALGYFGYAYYEQNKDKLGLVAIDGGKGPITPSPTTIADGTYQPLSRPLFLYITRDAAERPEVQAFVRFYLDKSKELVASTGYIPLPEKAYTLARARFEAKTAGSLFDGIPQVGIKIEDLLAKESSGR
jgi:phosphate transport system substrate-binding protein